MFDFQARVQNIDSSDFLLIEATFSPPRREDPFEMMLFAKLLFNHHQCQTVNALTGSSFTSVKNVKVFAILSLFKVLILFLSGIKLAKL